MIAGLQERLCRGLAAGPRLRLAILFGSHARGEARPDSDIDVAILPLDPGLTQSEEDALAIALEKEAGGPVDLVLLDQARPALRWRIARDGVVLYSNPPHEAVRFLARTGIEHDAVRELEQRAMRRFQKRLAETTSGAK